MSQERIAGIIQDVREGLKSGGAEIDEMTYLDFFDAAADAIAQLPASDSQMEDLLQDVNAAYAYGGADRLEGFAIGACWGSLKTLDACREAMHDAEKSLIAQGIVNVHYDLFSTIGRHPGISQGELAQSLDKQKSSMSQLLARLQASGLFSVSISGRFKHYYLTRLGERALGEVTERRLTEMVPHTDNTRPVALYQMRAVQTGYLYENHNSRVLADERSFTVQPLSQSDNMTSHLSGNQESLPWENVSKDISHTSNHMNNRPVYA